eukprot:jgi/Ulvmu1/4158/UM019_0137.1
MYLQWLQRAAHALPYNHHVSRSWNEVIGGVVQWTRSASASGQSVHAVANQLPILSLRQIARTRRILLDRQKLELKNTRVKGLKRFKKQVKDGRHDLTVPVMSWAAVTRGDTAAKQEMTVLQGSVFNRPVNPNVIHQVIRWQRALHRKPIASTKTKAEVRGGGRKPFPQKGSGRARQGSIRSPHMRGGGIIFGPKPRSFAFKLPKKVRRAGLMAALSARSQEGRVIIVDSLSLSMAESEQSLQLELQDIKEELMQLDQVFVRRHQFRNRVYKALNDDDGMTLCKPDGTLLDPDDALQAIMDRLRCQKTDMLSLLESTRWYKTNLTKLIPPSSPKKEPHVAASKSILQALNTFPYSIKAKLKQAALDKEGVIDAEAAENANGVTAMLTKIQNAPGLYVPKTADKILVIHSDKASDVASGVRRCVVNIPEINILPARGANVQDIIRHKYLIVTQAAVADLTNRAKRPLHRGFKPLGFDWQQIRGRRAAQAALERERRAKLASWLAARSPLH